MIWGIDGNSMEAAKVEPTLPVSGPVASTQKTSTVCPSPHPPSLSQDGSGLKSKMTYRSAMINNHQQWSTMIINAHGFPFPWSPSFRGPCPLLRPVSFNATDSEAPRQFRFFGGWKCQPSRAQMDQLLESLNGFLFTGGCNSSAMFAADCCGYYTWLDNVGHDPIVSMCINNVGDYHHHNHVWPPIYQIFDWIILDY